MIHWSEKPDQASTFQGSNPQDSAGVTFLEQPSYASKAKPNLDLEKNLELARYAGRFAEGRPMEYDPSLCMSLIREAARGFTVTAWGAGLAIDKDRLARWQASFPEFREAVNLAKGLRQRRLERGFNDVCENGGIGSQVTALMFGLKALNVDEWRDKQVIEHEGKISLSTLVTTSLKSIEEQPQVIDVTPEKPAGD